MLKKPLAIKFTRNNDIDPFEDDTEVEKHAKLSDASLVLFASHTKRRPNILTFMRMYDFHVLDMLEISLSSFKSMSEFPVRIGLLVSLIA